MVIGDGPDMTKFGSERDTWHALQGACCAMRGRSRTRAWHRRTLVRTRAKGAARIRGGRAGCGRSRQRRCRPRQRHWSSAGGWRTWCLVVSRRVECGCSQGGCRCRVKREPHPRARARRTGGTLTLQPSDGPPSLPVSPFHAPLQTSPHRSAVIPQDSFFLAKAPGTPARRDPPTARRRRSFVFFLSSSPPMPFLGPAAQPSMHVDESTAPQIDASTDSPPSRNFNAPARAPQQLQPSLHNQLEQRRRLRDLSVDPDDEDAQARAHRIRVKNRRKRYLDTHPEYFSSGLELADPLLYDRLVRRFQTPAEREAEGRAKGYSGVLEADLLRSEAKLQALHSPESSSIAVRRGPNGEILAVDEDSDDEVKTKEEGLARWRDDMGQRFLRGEDRDFRYEEVDESEEWDDVQEEEREAQDKYFDDEDPSWIHSGQGTPKITGETGVQDF